MVALFEFLNLATPFHLLQVLSKSVALRYFAQEVLDILNTHSKSPMPKSKDPCHKAS